MGQSDNELRKLLQPLITVVSEYNTNPFPEHLLEKEAEGILAWGVRSGYFLWVREHPGQLPTMQQVQGWLAEGLQRAEVSQPGTSKKFPGPKKRKKK